MFEILLMLVGTLLGAAIGQAQMEQQASRTAHENYVRSVFTAIRNRFGVTVDQLNQQADKLGINLQRLADAARGSARLSEASRIYRQYTEKYPKLLAKINSLKNQLNLEMNNLSRSEESFARVAQTGGQVSDDELGRATQQSVINANQGINQINTELSDINQNIGNKQDNNSSGVNEIETSLSNKDNIKGEQNNAKI